MQNALILHGAGNNSQGNWFPWLKGQLEAKGYKVKKGQGHFNLEVNPSYKEFPFLLTLIN